MNNASTKKPAENLLSRMKSHLNVIKDAQNDKRINICKRGQDHIDELNFHFDPENRKIEVDVYYTGKRDSPQECAEIVLDFIKKTNWETFLGKDFEHFKVKRVPTKISDFLSKEIIDDWDHDETECGCGALIVFQTTVKGMTATRKIFREKQKLES